MKTLELTKKLIQEASVTPNDGRCQTMIMDELRAFDFQFQTIASHQVVNLWAKRTGASSGPTVVFAGHTDVVPPGPLNEWHSDPFIPTERDGKLYGRGAADMKTSLAAFVVAAQEFVSEYPNHPGSIAFLLTSDEEGPATHGTVLVCNALVSQGEKLDYCIVGEPTSAQQLGDMIKNGRRGSMSGRLVVKGIQGHIAYPHLAKNPIHLFAPGLTELAQTVWDQGNDYFPPTTWQVSNIHSGTGATNVIPGEITVDFNFRFSTASTSESLQARVIEILDRHGLEYVLDWTISGQPFLTPQGTLCAALSQAITSETGLSAELSTTGGTSDGRFIAKICKEVVEFGPPNASIHKINEHIELAFIEPLKNIYKKTLINLLIV